MEARRKSLPVFRKKKEQIMKDGATRMRLILMLGAMVLAGCTTTMQTRSVEPSGFLGDYSQLRHGEGKEAQLVYFNDAADFSKYTKIQMDPIQMYAAPGSKLEKLDPEKKKALLDYFDASVRQRLGGQYVFVDAAGPGVMRLRIAVTEAKGSMVVLNTVSTIVPIGLALSTLKLAATGSHSAVASVQAEFELTDSESGERLAAAVDERAGRKITFRLDKLSKYAQVRDAFDYWAERLALRLAEAREQSLAGKQG